MGGLRISIPGDEPPYIVTVGANATDYVQGTARRDGSVVRFVTNLLESYGIQWVEVPITQASRAFSPSSSFTACVHDVALNNTDICAGSVWPFEYRRRLAHFTSSLKSVPFFVIAKRKEGGGKDSFSELIKRPFLPFDVGMWLGLFAALLYTAYTLYILDSSGYESEDDDDEADVTDATGRVTKIRVTKEMKKQVKYERDCKHMFLPTDKDEAMDLLLSVAHSAQAYFGGGDFRAEPRSFQAWIVFLSFSFLILVTTSNYTAQVTLFSVLSSSESTIESLDQVCSSMTASGSVSILASSGCSLVPPVCSDASGSSHHPCSKPPSAPNLLQALSTLGPPRVTHSHNIPAVQGIARGYRFCGWSSLAAPIEYSIPALRGL